MRTIKFRAWDKIQKEMCEVIELIHNGKYAKLYGLKNKWLDTRFDKDFELMQFTGLKDKNKKEIYEGDIFDSPSKNKFKVVWWKDAWLYQNVFDKKPCGQLNGVNRDWEVIGNIYENPELLK